MPYVAPAAVGSGAVISKTTFGDVVIADLNFLANPPACRVYNSAAISAANNAFTNLTFNTERYDTDSMHSTAALTGRITINTAGLYVVSGAVEFAANVTGIRQLAILLNNTAHIAVNSSLGNAASTPVTVTTSYKFAAGDYVELRVFQNSGAAINVNAAASMSPEFAAVWVGLG